MSKGQFPKIKGAICILLIDLNDTCNISKKMLAHVIGTLSDKEEVKSKKKDFKNLESLVDFSSCSKVLSLKIFRPSQPTSYLL